MNVSRRPPGAGWSRRNGPRVNPRAEPRAESRLGQVRRRPDRQSGTSRWTSRSRHEENRGEPPTAGRSPPAANAITGRQDQAHQPPSGDYPACHQLWCYRETAAELALRPRLSRIGWTGMANRTRRFSAWCGRPKPALIHAWSRSSPDRPKSDRSWRWLGQGHGGGGTASPSDLQRGRHPPEDSRADRSRPHSRSASPSHHHQCRREPNQTTRSTSAQACRRIRPAREERDQSHVAAWAIT